jgi:hydrogenase maturation protein HypF
MKRLHIQVKGIVQGVGFRPFIYNLAKGLDVKGYVTNTSQGVVIEAEGERLEEFIELIRAQCPPLAKIDNIEMQEMPQKGYEDFSIVGSVDHGSFTLVSPDISVCDDCLMEMFDPSDRRYLYPFINCTNCGPRYSITKKVPYDRPNTTMSVFNMCPECLSEYNDPADCRFHAQPNACPECGPQLEFQISNFKSQIRKTSNPIEETIELLKQGAIVAVKGIGGFHLCCDAENKEAVSRLREHKRKSNKPFALMSPDVGTIGKFCEVSDEEESLLKDRRRPIALLKKKGNGLPFEIAPNNKYLGFMLPYTPLHYLLFYYPSDFHTPLLSSHFNALVMTSGNIAEEPIVIDNEEAMEKLSFADAFLLHNRDIFMRVDDTVIRVRDSCPSRITDNGYGLRTFIRRARGYAPEPVKLKDDGPDVLGCGADLKNTFTIMKGSYAIASQHIGDMENIETLRFFEETLNNLRQVYRANPIAIAHDLHPSYLSTKWALDLKSQISNPGSQIMFYGIQHHYAHIASVMAEHGLKEKVIGVALDGTGYGIDGNIWGSEFLLCDLHGFERAAHFKYIPLPGGERAIKECWRTAISYIAGCGMREDLCKILDSIGFVARYGSDRIENIVKILDKRQFSPLSSGAGRLFDAVSALCGVCDINTFEGEAAIALENLVADEPCSDAYSYEISDSGPAEVVFSKMISEIIGDMRNGKDKSLISTKFHNTLVNAITDIASRISRKSGIKKIALSGGVFQNEYLMKNSFKRLSSLGLDVYINENVPCNDGCISLGQAYIAREKLSEKSP